MKSQVATLKEAYSFLTMADPKDMAEAARFARGMLGQDAVIKALTETVENLVKRCDECERAGHALSSKVDEQFAQHTRTIAKLQDQVRKLRTRKR